jgi:regulator of protease activity HflC (stomatin/prohibitin superfamily)
VTADNAGPVTERAAVARLAESAPPISEHPAAVRPGWPVLGAVVAAVVAGGVLIGIGAALPSVPARVIGLVLVLAGAGTASGLTPVSPGEARVVQLLGRYVGTIRSDGLQWVSPLTRRRRISTKIRNHETGLAKVNDADGNPIEIAAVVVWQVRDTARAMFGVDDFTEFVAIQAETAVRHLAGSYPYDQDGPGKLTLRDNADEITARLADQISERVAAAGVTIIEARLTRLSYAPEIAHAMLRRQQAGAVVAARQRIVDGAVGMVEAALAKLAADDIVDLDEERKAAMVSNLLVVLCSDQATQPVVNTGTLYQ